MGKKDKPLFEPHSAEKQKEYEREVRLQYDPQIVKESNQRWKGYSEAEKKKIGEEGNGVYVDLVEAIKDGKRPDGKRVQRIMVRWHQHLRYFYEPTTEILRGLGDLYTTHPDFIANFQKIHPELGDFMKVAINHYVDELETAELERLFAEDEARRRQDEQEED